MKLAEYITEEEISNWVITDEDIFHFLCIALGKLPPLKKNKKKKNKGFRTCYLEYKF